MIKVITDSASDIVDNKRKDLVILPVTITFGGEQFQDGVNLTHRDFYEKLIESDALPVTSQVTPFTFEEAYRQVKEEGAQAIVITLSSKLSGTWQSVTLQTRGRNMCLLCRRQKCAERTASLVWRLRRRLILPDCRRRR